MSVHQLAFDFTYPIKTIANETSWQIRSLTQRYGISTTLAGVYAEEMGLPNEPAPFIGLKFNEGSEQR